MNDFDQRWQTLACRAAAVDTDGAVEVPFGFTSRVLAVCRAASPESWEDLLNAYGRRALLVIGCMALIGAGVGFFDWYDFRLERPKLEQTLTAELPWL